MYIYTYKCTIYVYLVVICYTHLCYLDLSTSLVHNLLPNLYAHSQLSYRPLGEKREINETWYSDSNPIWPSPIQWLRSYDIWQFTGPHWPLKTYADDIAIKEMSFSFAINALEPHTKMAAITMSVYFSIFFSLIQNLEVNKIPRKPIKSHKDSKMINQDQHRFLLYLHTKTG